MVFLAFTAAALAQTREAPLLAAPPDGRAQPQQQPVQAEPEAPAEARAQRPRQGMFEAFGRWVDQSIANMKSAVARARGAATDIGGQAGEAAKDAAGAAQDAATSIVRIPVTSVVSGRQYCARAPNGSPDCRAATDSMCQAKGYTKGRSLDIQSAQKCPAWVWLSGRQPVEGECTLETYVTRAVCQ